MSFINKISFNSKCLYFLFILILFFSFNLDVFATTNYCLYNVSDSLTVKIDINSSGKPTVYYKESKTTDYKSDNWILAEKKYDYGFTDGIDSSSLTACPKYLTVSSKAKTFLFTETLKKNSTEVAGLYWDIKPTVDTFNSKGGTADSSSSTSESSDSDSAECDSSDTNCKYNPKTITGSSGQKVNSIDTCAELFGGEDSEIVGYLSDFVSIARILVPIILIVLGTLDMAQAVLGNEESMKKSQSKFIKRLIMGVAFFLIPSLIKFLLSIASGIWPDVISSDLCGIL